MEHVVIIGNGIAGVTLARHIRKNSNKRITLISAESEHFFSRTALMYVYMGHMKWNHLKPYEDHFWKKNRIELKKAYVEEVNAVKGDEPNVKKLEGSLSCNLKRATGVLYLFTEPPGPALIEPIEIDPL